MKTERAIKAEMSALRKGMRDNPKNWHAGYMQWCTLRWVLYSYQHRPSSTAHKWSARWRKGL